jgi:hypothetical protein
MRDLDAINRQQNYCSTMRINLGGHINGVKTWCALGGRLLGAGSQRSAWDAFGR